MLKVHTKSGLTERVDLTDEGQAKAWFERLKDPKYQANISGMSVAMFGVQYSLPVPIGFANASFRAELVVPDEVRKIKGGERIICQCDDVMVAMMVHQAQRAVRVSVSKTGKQRFDPFKR